MKNYKLNSKLLKKPLLESSMFICTSLIFATLMSCNIVVAQPEVTTLSEMVVTGSFEGELDESTMGDVSFSDLHDYSPASINNEVTAPVNWVWVNVSQYGIILSPEDLDFPTGQVRNLLNNSGLQCAAPKLRTKANGDQEISCGLSAEKGKGASLTAFDFGKNSTMNFECVGCENKGNDGNGNLRLNIGDSKPGGAGMLGTTFNTENINDPENKITNINYKWTNAEGYAIDANINPEMATGEIKVTYKQEGETSYVMKINGDGNNQNLNSVSLEATVPLDSGLQGKFEISYTNNKKDNLGGGNNVNFGDTFGIQFTIGGIPNPPQPIKP